MVLFIFEKELLFTYFKVVSFFFFRSEASNAFLSELLPQFFGVIARYFAAVFHVDDYFSCLLFGVASAEEIDYVWVVVGKVFLC